MGAGRSAPHLGKTIMAVLHSLMTDMFDNYRPERHYMRGPGPKWRAKQQPQIAAPPAGILSLRFAKVSN